MAKKTPKYRGAAVVVVARRMNPIAAMIAAPATNGPLL
jgi:hypothetical protein